MFGKPFYLSTTFYGLVIMGIGDGVSWLCSHGTLPTGVCSTVASIMGPIGNILALFGIRKAQAK